MDQHEKHNRERCDKASDRYQATAGVEIGAAPDAWGAWRIPEADLQILPDIAGKDVLELGCGGGQWSVWLAAHGAHVTGLDISGRQLDHARLNAEAAGAVSFHVPYGEWVHLFRANGLAIEALVEPKPAPDAISSFYPGATEWAQHWPAEMIWKVRREGR